MKQKPASLGMGLIATKGSAVPIDATAEVIKATPVKADVDTSTEDRTAVTVRLDKVRYRNLKMHGVDTKMTNQEIIVAALDAYLK